MDSTRPIRALIRGLETLSVLNRRNGATVSEVTGEIKLPRTTTYRILETLREAGYVYRDLADDRYRLTLMVRSLADGFDDEDWITQIGRPCINELCRDIVWPVTLLSPSGTSMLIRDTTDHASPLAVERFNAGFRLPLLMSASGRVYLAFCQAEHRDALLDILSRSTREEDKLARSRPEVEKILEETRELGYATSVRTRRISEEVAMSVPVLIGERVLATIAVRFSASAVPLRLAVERFVPKLFDTANVIRQRFSAAHPPV
ncbi:MAG TPA: helix-turn-helix domain-containing protein [Steroidobacteraceae bacterium]|jgi:IclR family mhp operon transcriptional activator|nr:helix-turn-helix domain-containing protein [Steroidobacteraceae bacterium]